ncbi:MAG: hypothetical protein ACPGUC_06575 [Gammaproteobacteria bacterium]
MSDGDSSNATVDWSKTTFEGAEKEAMRRGSELSLAEIIANLEEMERVSEAFAWQVKDDNPRRLNQGFPSPL